jgi:hypothetical protein
LQRQTTINGTVKFFNAIGVRGHTPRITKRKFTLQTLIAQIKKTSLLSRPTWTTSATTWPRKMTSRTSKRVNINFTELEGEGRISRHRNPALKQRFQ